METWAKLLLTKPFGLETFFFGTVVGFGFSADASQCFSHLRKTPTNSAMSLTEGQLLAYFRSVNDCQRKAGNRVGSLHRRATDQRARAGGDDSALSCIHRNSFACSLTVLVLHSELQRDSGRLFLLPHSPDAALLISFTDGTVSNSPLSLTRRIVFYSMSGDAMPSHEELGSDFVSIVVADSTRIHTQLLADALRNDRGLQVVAAASNSEELL